MIQLHFDGYCRDIKGWKYVPDWDSCTLIGENRSDNGLRFQCLLTLRARCVKPAGRLERWCPDKILTLCIILCTPFFQHKIGGQRLLIFPNIFVRTPNWHTSLRGPRACFSKFQRTFFTSCAQFVDVDLCHVVPRDLLAYRLQLFQMLLLAIYHARLQTRKPALVHRHCTNLAQRLLFHYTPLVM